MNLPPAPGMAQSVSAAHAALEESEVRYRSVVELSPGLIAIYARTGELLYINPAGLRLFGASAAGDLLGRPVGDFLVPQDKQATALDPPEVPGADLVERGEWQIRALDGRQRSVEGAVRPIRYGGEAARLLVAHDVTRRNRALDERARLAAIVESSNDAIIGKTLDGIITSWNRGAQQIYGYSAEEIVGRPISLLVPPDRPDELPAIFARLRAGQRIEHHETERLRKDGTRIAVELSISPIRDAAGTVSGAATIARDITAQKKAAQALQESEERYRRLAELSPDAIAVQQHGRLVYTNPAFARLLGAPAAGELTGRAVLELVPTEQRDRLRQWLDQTTSTRASTPVEQRIRRLDGGVVEVEAVGVAILYEGAPAVLLVFHDLTERKRAEEARATLLREQAAREHAEAAAEARALYEAVAVHLVDGLGIQDRDGRLVFWNPRMEELFGIPAAAVIGRRLDDVLAHLYARTADPQATRQRAADAIAAMEATGAPTSFEYRLEGDSPRDLAVLLFPISAPDGTRLGHGRLVRDVTREREVDRLKDELVSVVSHELRTPLASLVGFTELLLAREVPEEQRREFLDTMLHEGRRLTALINDFLDLQRIESGRQEIVPIPAALPPLLAQAVEAAGVDPLRPIALRLPATLPPVLVDIDRLSQVMGNLLDNARKYSPAGGSIQVRARVAADGVEIAVQDHGLGIPAEALPRLFTQFYRIDNSDRRRIKGTGLGLAISRKLVEGHGGRMWAESEGIGRGATFRFTLPIAHEGSHAGDVLIVEDDAGFAQLLTAELTARGYSSLRVPGAEAALAYLRQATPRAVVLDLLLPGLSGEALLARLRQEGIDTPVVVVSVMDLDEDARRQLGDLHISAVLRKGPGVAAAAAEQVHQILQRPPVGSPLLS